MVLGFKIRKNISLLILFGLGLAYFVSRLTNLLTFPVFTDEAIYLRWSQIMWHDAAQRFLPLSDGKTPLFMWIGIVIMRFFDDPVLAGRLISVFAGLASMIGIFMVSNALFQKKWLGLVGSFLYIVIPFTLTYDRMALAEALLLSLEILTLYFAIILARSRRLDIAIFAGILWGAAILAKPPAFLFGVFFPLSLLIMPNWKNSLVAIVPKWIVTGIFAAAMFGILFLSPGVGAIFSRSGDYAFTKTEIIQNGLTYPFFNSKQMTEWLVNYLSWPLAALALLGVVLGILKRRKVTLILLANFLIIFASQAITGKVVYPRYLLIMMPFLILFIVLAFEGIGYKFKLKSWQAALLLLVMSIAALNFDRVLLFNPTQTPFVRIDKGQYLSFWSSGQGIKEVSDFIKDKSKNGKVYVASEGYFGNPLNGLQIYLDNDPDVEVLVLSQPTPDKIRSLPKDFAGKEVYFVVNLSRWQFPDKNVPIDLIKTFPKIPFEGEQNSLLLYKVRT